MPEGYAGFVAHHPPLPVQFQIFSVWNNPDVGPELKNRFIDINTADGFVPFERPPMQADSSPVAAWSWSEPGLPERAVSTEIYDVNFARIQNSVLGWHVGREYTYRLAIESIPDDAGELWTHYTAWITEHATSSAETDQTYRYGTIARYGEWRQRHLNSFVEAMGQEYNHLGQAMEYLAVTARVAGEESPRQIPLQSLEVSEEPFIGDRYPCASWLTGDALRVMTGGLPPPAPGLLLLDY